MPIQGFVRLRKHQYGRQAAFGTAVAASKVYPFQGVPDVNLNWTDREVDEGSRFRIAAPYRGAPELTASYTDDAVEYNTMPLLLCALLCFAPFLLLAAQHVPIAEHGSA